MPSAKTVLSSIPPRRQTRPESSAISRKAAYFFFVVRHPCRHNQRVEFGRTGPFEKIGQGIYIVVRTAATETWSLPIPAIEIDHLTVKLDGQKLFSGLDLDLHQGQKLTLTGRSGCGKSTLLHCLLGFVEPAEGTIRIFGEELTSDSVWQLRTRMAYVAQEPAMGTGKVRDLLKHPFTFNNNRHLRNNIVQVPELMERLYLHETLLDKDISTLSGGEKQRFALISALLLDRDILLLDEASSAMDQAAKHAVIGLLGSSEKLTVLSVSHDQEWIGFSDEVVDLAKAQQGVKL
jgi:ABC-type iron transport system FetAB ATPase subunit